MPKEYIVKSAADKSGYTPDVIVLDQTAIANEPRWKKESIITIGASVRLAVEVVSTNWRDDYFTKARDYEEMGIPEYWIVDYLVWGAGSLSAIPNNPRSAFMNWLMGSIRSNSLGETRALSRLHFLNCN